MSGRIGWIFLLYGVVTCAQTSGAIPLPPRSGNLELVCLSEILIKTPQSYDPSQAAGARRKAQELLARIHNGEKFEDIARRYSQGPTAAQGGQRGAFKHGQLSKQIEDVAFALKPGDVSEVIRTGQGFVILQRGDCAKLSPAQRNASERCEILNGALGVDFGSYRDRLEHDIQSNWFSLILQSPPTERGKVTIEFRISKNRDLDRVRIVRSSGREELDRAAMRAITASAPFSAFPGDFTGNYLDVRFRFLYYPLRGQP
jgi:TonB family protein